MKTNIEKCKDLFNSISCLCCEGPEFMTKIELMSAIGKDAIKGYDICVHHLSSEPADGMAKLVENQEDMPAEFSKAVDEHFDELI